MPSALPESALLHKIERRLNASILGEKLIGNTLRGLFVEAMIAEVLSPNWDWVAANWSSWDFENRKNWCAVEVKQSAALQPWSHHYGHAPKPRFDIADRTGYWDDENGTGEIVWTDKVGRHSEIYVFAWHALEDTEADHRVPEQWAFYVVRERDLPKQKTIGLSGVAAIAEQCSILSLPDTLDRLSRAIKLRKLRRGYLR
jgi:hypothetical protein